MPRQRKKPPSIALVARLMPKPVPRSVVRLEGGPPELVAVPFVRVGDKAVALNRKDLREMGISAEEAGRIACAGLREQVPVKVASAGNGILAIGHDEIPFVSGYALALDRIPKLRLGEEGALVAVPNAHLLAVRPIRRRGLKDALEQLVPGTVEAFREGQGPLTPDLYWWRAGRWTRIRVEIRGMELRVHLVREFERLLE